MTRTRIAFTSFVLSLATVALVAQAPPPVTPVFDNETTGSIGAIAIAPTDANLVWVGTGEGNNLQSSSWGEGVFKSTDTGATELVMDPSNNKTSLVHQASKRLGIGHAAEEGCVGARRNLRRPGTAGSTKGA